jgi:hypothetical protein
MAQRLIAEPVGRERPLVNQREDHGVEKKDREDDEEPETPETPPDEPQPAPVQDPPAEPIQVPYVVRIEDRRQPARVAP